jgi:hypothetical protein
MINLSLLLLFHFIQPNKRASRASPKGFEGIGRHRFEGTSNSPQFAQVVCARFASAHQKVYQLGRQ